MPTTLSNQNKMCASCDLWGGARKANLPYPAVFITVEPNEKGICMGGGFNNMDMNAIATCSSWKKWGVLR